MRRGACLAVAVAVATSWAGSARASMFDTYGYGTRAISMGNAMTALSTSYDGVYYNPANLVVHKEAHIGFGLNFLAPLLHIDRVSGGSGDFERRLPSENLNFHLGTAAPLGGVFEKKVAFGIVLFHPLIEFTRVQSLDPTVPYYYRYDEAPSKLIIAAGLAYEPLPWLRFGVGAQMLAELDGSVNASLSLNENRFTSESLDIDLLGTMSPTAGLSVGPFEGFRVGVAYRHELQLSYHLPVDVLIEEVGHLRVEIDGISLYTPGQLAAGVSWEGTLPGDMGFAAEIGLRWDMWSRAPDAGATYVLEVDDSVLRKDAARDGRETQNLVETRRDPIPLGAKDTLTFRLGAELRPKPDWAVRIGYFYRPTPLPEPRYEGNSLDVSAHVVSVGFGYTFLDPTGVKSVDEPLIVDFGLQATILPDRTVTKADGYEPEGAYEAGGVILNVSLGLRHNF